MLFEFAASSLPLIVLLSSFFFSCSSCGIDGTFSSCMKHGSVTERPTGRLYGVFGFNNRRFNLSLSESRVSVDTSSSEGRRRFVDDEAVAVVGNALETRRTSPNGVLDCSISSRIRWAVVDRRDFSVPSVTLSDDVDFDKFDGTSLDGILARCCCE